MQFGTIRGDEVRPGTVIAVRTGAGEGEITQVQRLQISRELRIVWPSHPEVTTNAGVERLGKGVTGHGPPRGVRGAMASRHELRVGRRELGHRAYYPESWR